MTERLLSLAMLLSGLASAGESALRERIVFLGSSSTDGFTYPLLAGQALEASGKPVPLLHNAGAGGNTAADMLKRFDRDVAPWKPARVVIQSGVNDASKAVPLDDYLATVRQLIERAKANGAKVVLLTPNRIGAKHGEAVARVAAFAEALRKLAGETGCALGDPHALMEEAAAQGAELLEADALHPNFAGYRLLARAVLNALGHPDVPVPEALEAKLLPGVISEWRLSPVLERKTPPLDAAGVAALTPDATWVSVRVPQPLPEQATHWWQDQIRREGYVLGLKDVVGAGARYFGLATVDRAEAGAAVLNTGGQLQTVWLNGVLVYKSKEWTGYHAGRERIPVELKAGANRLVIETGDSFFVSLTETPDW